MQGSVVGLRTVSCDIKCCDKQDGFVSDDSCILSMRIYNRIESQ